MNFNLLCLIFIGYLSLVSNIRVFFLGGELLFTFCWPQGWGPPPYHWRCSQISLATPSLRPEDSGGGLPYTAFSVISERHQILVGLGLVDHGDVFGEAGRNIARPLMMKDVTSTGSLAQVSLRKVASLPAILHSAVAKINILECRYLFFSPYSLQSLTCWLIKNSYLANERTLKQVYYVKCSVSQI